MPRPRHQECLALGIPRANDAATGAEATEVTDGDRRRDDIEWLDDRRLGGVAERDVWREALEARFPPELADPAHIAVASVCIMEGRRIASVHFEGLRHMLKLLVQVEKLRRALNRHPDRVAALAAASDA